MRSFRPLVVFVSLLALLAVETFAQDTTSTSTSTTTESTTTSTTSTTTTTTSTTSTTETTTTSTTTTTAPGTTSTSTSTISTTQSFATPSPSLQPNDPVPSGAPVPPKQSWCTSDIFCAGPLLQTVALAHLYVDDKTFVDKPTSQPSSLVLSAFSNLTEPITIGNITSFVQTYFAPEGLELQPISLPSFDPNPPFLNNVSDPLVRGFAGTVHGYWTQLARETNRSALCSEGQAGVSGGAGCESSLIPLNHSFVVPGGRFREQYYWDSFWIVEGLIESRLFRIINGTLQNFMDELDVYGFIPNGGRTYQLNRSQPPLFVQMLSRYVSTSNDTSILRRALPLAEKELRWFNDNRSVRVKSPYSNRTFTMYRFSATNTSAPRPESYLTDYLTANDPTIDPPFNDTQKADLYAELAAGAESGWDYTMRWFVDGNVEGGLKTLDVRNTIAVDLNSIVYRNHILLADLYTRGRNQSAARRHRTAAASLKEGILDLLWDSEKVAFYDFSLRSQTRNNIFTVATFYPFWSGIIPPSVLQNETTAFQAFSSVNMLLNRYNGTYPTTWIDTHLQWDAPNTWPPHQYIVLQALRSLPSNITSSPLPQPLPNSNQSTFDLIPPSQLGLSEAQLPGQPVQVLQDGSGGTTTVNATMTGPGADINRIDGGRSVFNGGKAQTRGGVPGGGGEEEGWAQTLERELANRYVGSALCSWHATGGEISGILPRLSDDKLAVTNSVNNTGNMFEKFSNLDMDSAGRGGEYVVQAGFGWTNGVLLWTASRYGQVLDAPVCPDIQLLVNTSTNTGNNITNTTTDTTTGDGTDTSAALPKAMVSSSALLVELGLVLLAWFAVGV